jgi:hypothetical protein
MAMDEGAGAGMTDAAVSKKPHQGGVYRKEHSPQMKI